MKRGLSLALLWPALAVAWEEEPVLSLFRKQRSITC